MKKYRMPYRCLTACVLVFCVCGWLSYAATGSMADWNRGEESAVPEESGGTAAAPAGTERLEARQWCSQTLYPAAQQEVPELLENVTTLVNCPVLDEKDPVLYLTIGNVGETPIRYLDRYELEVCLEDGWYTVPSGSARAGEWLVLESGMAVDEEIDLAQYRMDYRAERYRLIVYVDGEPISAEFTFEEVFSEQMEKLEEESSGE